MNVPTKFKFTSFRNPAFVYVAERKEDGTYHVVIEDSRGFEFNFTADKVQNDLEDGVWTITENLMVQRYTFEISGYQYEAVLEDNEYVVKNIISGWVSSLRYSADELVSEYGAAPAEREPEVHVANGVDAQGNPKNFTKYDLKIFQRVIDRSGSVWIVLPSLQDCEIGQLVLMQKGEWNSLYLNEDDEYDAVEVYDAPEYNNYALNFDVRGKLIWREDANVEKRRELQSQIDSLQEQLAALK